VFLSKAQTLLQVQSKVSIFTVPNFLYFDAALFDRDSASIVEKIHSRFKYDLVALRSSASDEDRSTESCAGEYDTVLNIPADNSIKIAKAIDIVINSYQRKNKTSSKDEVIVQEMVQNTSMSGVIFTHDLNTGAPYYVINYDDQSGLTDTVTSGDGEHSNRVLYIHRNSTDKLRSERFAQLLLAVQELEQVMGSEFLDIEFAIGKDLTPYLLQVRTITTQLNWNTAIPEHINKNLRDVQSVVAERFRKVKGVYGKTTLLGQMPDWNPVEMIGRAPRALAASLYKILITNHVWSDARLIMGYQVPAKQPLMLMLAGQPFIDTRLSFHSYLPKAISPTISEKLVNHWTKRLQSFSELHDKIEFDVAITTYSFDFDKKMDKLVGNSLTPNEKREFKRAHLEQTKSLIKGKCDGSLDAALKQVKILKDKQEKNDILPLSIMVKDCIQFGTIPFAVLARHGFIAKTILISLRDLNIITQKEMSQIQASIHTVASSLIDDMQSLQTGEISHNDFMERYGHLRPGTYDIMSHRYDQMDEFFSGISFAQPEQNIKEFSFTQKQKQQINELLIKDGFGGFDADNLLDYINEATIGREYGKFVFSRSVSDMLEIIADFAKNNGLNRNKISHVPLGDLLNFETSSGQESAKVQLEKIYKQKSAEHEASVATRLPQLLADQEGVYIVPFQVSHPNFITHKKITAPCQVLTTDSDEMLLDGKIVLIEGADPGFDWIFSQRIAGLVTKYGGANSHMAIRCAEFRIPAAIGCGEQYFDTLVKSNKVYLDCAAGLIHSLH